MPVGLCRRLMMDNLRYGNTLVTAGDHCKLVLSNEPSLDLASVSEFLVIRPIDMRLYGSKT